MNLVVMAAGMGSRFGGLKQLTPVGLNGEFLIDYSIYDAKKAGVNKVIFVIRKDMEEEFRKTIGKRIEKHIKVCYAYQELEDTPIKVKQKRTKPWGTGQALLASRNQVDAPFMVINADDFYGRDAFIKLGNFLKEETKDTKNHYAMVAYLLKNTLSDNGSVSRGICEIKNGFLKKITEYTKIEKIGNKIISSEEENQELPENTLVSLNLFGFTQEIFKDATNYFEEFLLQEKNLETKEFYLPSIVQKTIDEGNSDMKVLSTTASFQGMTYKEDKDKLKEYIKGLIEEGIYPEKLWEESHEK